MEDRVRPVCMADVSPEPRERRVNPVRSWCSRTVDWAFPDRFSTVLAWFGTWAVTTYGLEAVEYDYPIAKCRLWEADWYGHVTRKNWVNAQDFGEALLAAQELHAAYNPRGGAGASR